MNKDVREIHDMLTDIGYNMTRSRSHLIYELEGFRALTVPATPSDWRWKQNTLAEIKRRHPARFVRRKAPVSRPRVGMSARIERARARQLKSAETLAEQARVPRPEPFVAPERTECADCGRPWLSDLDPLTHSCPSCGGAHILGRSAA